MTLPHTLTLRHFLLLLAVSALLLFLLIAARPQQAGVLRAPLIPAVVVTEVRRGDVRPSLHLGGRLQPRTAASLSAEVAGSLVERLAEPGQVVEQGALLLRMDEGDYRDALVRAEAQLSQEKAAVARDRRLLKLAKQNRELQQKEVGRQQRLGTESLASLSRLDEAKQRLLQLEGEEARLDYAVTTAEARLALREAELKRAERDLARTRITAPFAGTVNEVLADVGDRIKLNQSLVSLMVLDELDFYAELPGDAHTDLTLGQRQSIAVAGERHEGVLVALQREPDRSSHTRALRIRLPGEGLAPGMLASTELPLQPLLGALQVPVSALLREEGRAYLFVEQEGRLSRREVETGMRDGDAVVILSGVEADERIVARDVAALSDGQQVKVAVE